MATRMKRTRSSAPDAADGDLLLNIDPSLMTERQQLAFLLRTTAQKTDASDVGSSSSSSSTSESSDDEMQWRATKKPRRARTSTASKASPKSPPCSSSREELIAAALKNPNSVVVYCGRGRPPKNAIKLAPGEELPDELRKLVSPQFADAIAKHDLRVRTHVDTGNPEENHANKRRESIADTNTDQKMKPLEKTSPSSTNDHDHMQVFEDHHTGPWSSRCALCCQPDSPFDARFDALFLCPACDRKYPTQRALGLV